MVKKRFTQDSVCQIYDTNVAAKNIWLMLLEDFRASEGQEFATKAERAFEGDIACFREYKFPELGIISPNRFKMWKQLEGLLKKFRFNNDRYTDEELNSITRQRTVDDQEYFSSLLPEASPLVHQVLQCARKHAKRILGHIDHEKVVELSRFGKKSSIGCPLNLAYIDQKLTEVAAFTGSSDCSKWFMDEVLPGDPILQELVREMGIDPSSEYMLHETLNLVLVPKSWKSFRPITPLTLLGLFYSYGVGEQITSCLKVEGLDLSRLQSIHSRLVRINSVVEEETKRPRLATADLTNASQSLISDLLNRVLPREWYCAIKKTFSHTLIVKNSDNSYTSTYTESVLPMGNGLTFPVETLVFYVILKAIAELSKVRGRISVYGDDLIYPVRLHKYVSVIFPKIKFLLNLDKTFVRAPFRESCGSDFYCGFDVRPAFLPDERQMLSKQLYTVWLYKCYNALMRRWAQEEIPKTAEFLLKELNSLGFQILRVPPSFPDTAGIKVESPWFTPMERKDLNWAPIAICYYSGSRWFHFSYLTTTPHRRCVKSVLPYYWLALQGKTDDLDTYRNFWETDYSYLATLPKTSLTWKNVKRYVKQRKTDGKAYRVVEMQQLITCASRSGTSVNVSETKRESISDWF